ncbi:MAG: permease [Arcobacter sp.]|uniref:EamA family transporter n=1 Tax=uncultured Arcobacter sp. TaxID=165434 RepID=UPI000CB27EBD|nr:EamA family transporter [uncultured Arcobacter sp.]PLY11170.1 MAG: permease [Arcobacter sp.]
MNLKSVTLALLVVLIWGVNFSVIKFGLEELPPILFSSLRFFIVAIPAIFFIPFPKTSIWNVLGVGLFLGVLKFSFLFIAMKADASAGISSLLLQAQVIFTIILSVIIFKEKISTSQLIGMLIAFTGFGFFFFNVNTNITFLGLILILSAAIFWSISNIIMKQIKGVNLLHFMVWVSLIPPLPLFILSYIFETHEPLTLLFNSSIKTWTSLAYTGYISTLVAFAIWGWLLKNYNTALVTPFALLIPVVGIVSSNILLNEQLTNIEAIGGILILSGLCISMLGKKIVNFLENKKST